MNSIIKLKRDIEKTKQKLIQKVKDKGIYENFGQNEVDKLKIKHINISSYNNENNQKRDLIQDFNNWAMVYNG